MITFADAANAENLVDKYTDVALYGEDCDHPCPKEIADKWDVAHKRYITFAGHPKCSIIDFEKFTRDYNDPHILRAWLEGRHREFPHQRIPWIYANLTSAPTAARYAQGLPFKWWIATLDGVRRSPGQLADLMAAWGTPAEFSRVHLIAANQWKNIPDVADESVCFVNADW